MRVVVAGLVSCLLGCGSAGREDVEAASRQAAEARPQPASTQALAAPASSRSRPRPRLSREALLDQLQTRLSRPERGLRVETGPDGTRRIALDGHLQHATIAVVGPDGQLRTRCVDSPAAAAHALGVEPGISRP
jgi:hypothetical protein